MIEHSAVDVPAGSAAPHDDIGPLLQRHTPSPAGYVVAALSALVIGSVAVPLSLRGGAGDAFRDRRPRCWQDVGVAATIIPIELETDRLILRRRRADDAAAFREIWTERDVKAPPHRRIGADGRPTVEDIAAQIRSESGAADSAFLTIMRKLESDVIGYCGLLFHGRGSPDEPELAYELLRRAHGVGYATEATLALVAWAAESGYRRLWAGVRMWNGASINVLHKLGFTNAGRVAADAEFGDSLIMALTFPTTAR